MFIMVVELFMGKYAPLFVEGGLKDEELCGLFAGRAFAGAA